MPGSDSRDVYSWDTCIFLALFKKEADKPLADIIAVANEIEVGRADMVVSTIVMTEMLDIITDPSLESDFKAFLRRPNVFVANLDPRVARKVAEIRSAWRCATPEANGNVSVPDAAIITTAILGKATVLHSFDDKVLRFNKHSIVDGLEIIKPVLAGGQRVLPEINPGESSSDAKEITDETEASCEVDSLPANTGAGDSESPDCTTAAKEEAPVKEKEDVGASPNESAESNEAETPAQPAVAVARHLPSVELTFAGEVAASSSKLQEEDAESPSPKRRKRPPSSKKASKRSKPSTNGD